MEVLLAMVARYASTAGPCVLAPFVSSPIVSQRLLLRLLLPLVGPCAMVMA